jgi:hypothetical protein
MDRDTIIRLAIEAKLVCDWDGGCASAWVEGHDLTPYLERFAALVAEQDTALLRQAYLLCDEINKMPHVRGSINGMAVQLQYALRERLALSDAALLASKPGQLKDRGTK